MDKEEIKQRVNLMQKAILNFVNNMDKKKESNDVLVADGKNKTVNIFKI